jgi:hypothetical protein
MIIPQYRPTLAAVKQVKQRIRSDGDECGMLVDGYSLTASGAPRVSGHPKGRKFRPVLGM